MADFNEKVADSSTKSGSETPPLTLTSVDDEGQREKRGKPWMYKRYKIGPWMTPAYVSPAFQITFVAMVCFLCPGMFNAVNGLGAGGLVDAHVIDNANTALYSMFAGVGFFAGSIANRLGLRVTLGFGGFGYCLYIIAILSYNHDGNAGFLIFSGALLGLCAGLLWTAQGAIMMSYPREADKGKYIAVFWMIFNLGGVIGALIPLGQNLHATNQSPVSDGTYIAFIVLMASGFVLALFLCDPRLVTRNDGSKPVMMKNPTWKTEIFGLFETLKTDWYIVLLFPMFLSSNWFYTYHFQDFNLARFNTRTRALNNVLYWSSQIIGALVFGYSLDMARFRRTVRAKAALFALLIITMAIWGGGYAFQKTYTRESVKTDPSLILDFKDSGYIGPMFLYMFYGFYDAAWQTTVYWYVPPLFPSSLKIPN
jgi:MFS family permease